MTLFIIVLIIGIAAVLISGSINSKKEVQSKEPLNKTYDVPPATPEKKPAIPSFSEIMAEQMAKDEPKKKRETLHYFCTSDNGYGYITVWPKDQMIPDYMEFDIAGTSYRKGLMKYTGEFKGRLEEEPTNEYDPKAIKILAEDGHHVGYVPKSMTDSIRDFMPLPCTCYCYLHRRREDGKYIFFGSAYITHTPPEE